MAVIEWAMWGNEQGLASGLVLLVGGILAVIGQFRRWEFGAYGIALGALICFLEYPRGDRMKGSSRRRRFQNIPAAFIKAIGPLGSNYYIRFVVYLLACVPCVFQAATVLGAISLLVTSLIHLKAALNGEKWQIKGEQADNLTGKTPSRMRPPSHAPPRLKTKQVKGRDNVGNEIEEKQHDSRENGAVI